MLNTDELVESFLEITLLNPEDFLKVKETLTRIGISSKQDKKLFQSCHILQKKGKYYIVHFKELIALDGKETDFSENDLARRNTIANLLEQWGLLSLVVAEKSKNPVVTINQLKIIPYKEKMDWELIPKYTIGKSKKRN